MYVIEPERIEDERGFFSRTFCRDEFSANGLVSTLVQCSASYNHKRGTLRGLHFQAAPHEEVKVVRCTRGAMFDVVVDLRPASPTYCKWISAELNENNGRMIYIPMGCAHGFQTVMDATEVFYQMSTMYNPAAGRGVRWNDRAIGIKWPIDTPIVSARDAGYPDLAT